MLPTDPADDGAPRCSARGCREPATTDLVWRNPAIHEASRQKHWYACTGHEEFLADFLTRRDFPVVRVAL